MVDISTDAKVAEQARSRNLTRAEDLRETLEGMIVEGTLPPGTRLDETELAHRFGVSRTPVREAVRSLIATGLVEVRGRQGTIVSVLSIGMLLEMFELMSALEALCAGLAARRATSDQKRAMRAIHDRLLTAFKEEDPDAFYRINAEFHDLIYEASHTEFLSAQTIALRRRIAPYRRGVTWQPGRMRDTLGEHEAILDAIDKADSETARKAAGEHVRLLGDQMSDFIASVPRSILK